MAAVLKCKLTDVRGKAVQLISINKDENSDESRHKCSPKPPKHKDAIAL